MSFAETHELTPNTLTAATLVGAASPLWGFYAGAAATGVAFWWMTRWAQPANLEALFGGTASSLETVDAVALKAVEPLAAAVEAVEETTERLVQGASEAAGPMAETASEPAAEMLAEASAVVGDAEEALVEQIDDVSIATETLLDDAAPKARKPKSIATDAGDPPVPLAK